MSEPMNARAMAFRVEGMEREDRVEALEQWGDDREEAGRREIEEAACLRGQHVARRPGGCACGHMPPLNLRSHDDEPLDDDWTNNDDLSAPAAEPNVFEQIEQGAWRVHDPPLTPEPEQPSSLAERIQGHLTIGAHDTRTSWQQAIERSLLTIAEEVTARAEAIDALTERTESHVHEVLRGDVDALTAGSRLVSAVVDGLTANVEELKAWAEEHPAAPEPGA